jgi:hypothetical protein
MADKKARDPEMENIPWLIVLIIMIDLSMNVTFV